MVHAPTRTVKSRDAGIDTNDVDACDVRGHVEHGAADPRGAPWCASAQREIQRRRSVHVAARGRRIVAVGGGSDIPDASRQVVEAVYALVIGRR